MDVFEGEYPESKEDGHEDHCEEAADLRQSNQQLSVVTCADFIRQW